MDRAVDTIRGRQHPVLRIPSHEISILRIFFIGLFAGIAASIIYNNLPEQLTAIKLPALLQVPLIKPLLIGLMSIVFEYVFRCIKKALKESA